MNQDLTDWPLIFFLKGNPEGSGETVRLGVGLYIALSLLVFLWPHIGFCVCVFSCVWLFDPMDCSPLCCSVHGLVCIFWVHRGFKANGWHKNPFFLSICLLFLYIFLNLVHPNSCRAFIFDQAYGDRKLNKETKNEPSYFRCETHRQASLDGDLDQSSLYGQLRTLACSI